MTDASSIQHHDPHVTTYLVWADPETHCEVRYDAQLAAPSGQVCPVAWFEPNTPLLRAQPVQVGGRAAAWFIQLSELQAVLRHYRRGGWVARLARDQYLWQGADRARSFAEFALLQTMRAMDLPVPRPLAALVCKKGWIYRAALVTERIPQARPLSACTDPALWQEAGRVIAKMHHAGIWHADLNVFNVLIDGHNQVWLIDFDRSRQRTMHSGLRTENIARLLRSVRKVAAALEVTCWSSLTRGYQDTWQTLNPESA
jgi:3-deoxy-D-manno-octulosonic acid kinase